MNIKSRQVHLVSHPSGNPAAANFAVAENTLAVPKNQEVVVRNLFMSVDPYMRGRMNAGKSYVSPPCWDTSHGPRRR